MCLLDRCRQVESPEKWRENMEAQKAMMKQHEQEEEKEKGAADVDDLDDD